jgi:RNA-directed DNA polymerase
METLKEKEIAIYAKANEFLQVKDIDDVAQLIQVKTESLLEIIEKSDESYYKFRIPKKRGGYREIDSPNGNLKLIQRRINYLLSVIYYGMKPACVHGFVKSVTEQSKSFSIASNAVVHVKAQYVLNMDIKDFFHSVDIWRVKRVFMSYPFFFENDMAAFMALLCTYQERLPMGAPTSPVVSNLACFLFDRRMMRFAEEQELRFTRYADDLTFSSSRKIMQTTIDAATHIIKEYGFAVNEKKTRTFTSGGRQVVTGLKVNERVNVGRKYIRNIRAMLNNWATHGLVKASAQNENPYQFLNILKGKLDFLSMVKGKNDAVYLKLHAKFWHLQHLQA